MRDALARLRGVAREPLLQFFAIGTALTLIFEATGGMARDPGNDRTIVVDREALGSFLQYRSGVYQPAAIEDRLNALSTEERKRLVEDYVREETLYREAKALGLGQNDSVVRRRLVQSMEFLLEHAAASGDAGAPTDTALGHYLQEHRDRYEVAPSWTFTHVFFDAAVRGPETAAAEAARTLRELNSHGRGFNDAPGYGDRFPYLQNYVDRTSDYLTGHFGAGFLSRLSGLRPADRTWQGPLVSEFGYHLVLLTAHKAGRLPQLEEIRQPVVEDFDRDRAAEARLRAIDEISRRYRVRTTDLFP